MLDFQQKFVFFFIFIDVQNIEVEKYRLDYESIVELKDFKKGQFVLSLIGNIFFVKRRRREKFVREKEQYVFRKVKSGLKRDVLKCCLEERVRVGEC